MVGEIRDAETAENAIQAALTGHLVLSTLHTNDAPTAITRLADMGSRYLVGSTILLVVAQRLVRRICPHCVEEYEAPRTRSRRSGCPRRDTRCGCAAGAGAAVPLHRHHGAPASSR